MRVLFVCVENTCRSVMAEAVFNRMARRWRAESAGLKAGGEYDSMALRVLEERGYEVVNREPRSLDSVRLEDYALVVTVCDESLCVSINHPRVERWSVEDPKGGSREDYVRTLEELEKRVVDLVRRLEDEGA
ncbi:arsenate-mycothiol transferase ArsC [Geoglobus ahangari]